METNKIFDEYVSNYDMENENISRKYYHTYKVVANAMDIAKSLKLEKEDLELVYWCALLHDIGRFEQMRIYGTYKDSESIDHGLKGYEVLLDNNLIDRFVTDEKSKKVILVSVLNHNKQYVDESLTDYEKFITNIIRDADKLNIMKEQSNAINDNSNTLNELALKDTFDHSTCLNTNVITEADKVLARISFIFDINFKRSLEIILEDKILEHKFELLRANIKDLQLIDKIEKELMNYIEDKILLDEFDNYVSNYDMGDADIKLKYNHSKRVMEINKLYAGKLNFNEKEIILAKQIGLLHDIGRFEQLKEYHSYDDSTTINHTEYGVKILFDDNLIRTFIKTNSNDNIIRDAIFNHNKFEINAIDDEETLKQAYLIRDSDKLDILYILSNLNEIDITTTNEPLNDNILLGFKNNKSVDYKYVKTRNEELAVYFGYAFDIHYNIYLTKMLEYINEFYSRLEHKEVFENVFKEVVTYIKERIDD